MFGEEPPKKNRRLTPKEMQLELELCTVFKRRPRHFFYDKPFYDWLPPTPKVPKVNFDLNYP